jgi:3-phenylpropionate/trans-cinnamate dioxygenase ferredoxin reductase subunit
MSSSETFVIIGASLAGAKAAEALRGQGFSGRVVVLGAERHRPYERPPLSKGYLLGADERDKGFVHTEAWYADHAVELQLGQPATEIDRGTRRIELADGTSLAYDQLLLATGSSPRILSVPRADADGVHYLRTIDESDALRALLGTASRLVVIGAGWIGLEVTAAARQAGIEVVVVETAALPLLQVLGPEVAQVFADLHTQHGAEFRFNAALESVRVTDGRASGVVLADGSVIDADAVLVAIGAVPNTELAEAAGMQVDNGIVVDSALRSSDPAVFAAGDVANALNPFYGRHIRVEHWANALNQPAVAAASMLGNDATYDELPYFFTDQYDLGMEYVGYAEPGGYDQVVIRGDAASREFMSFWLKDGRVLAGMNVNVWDVTDQVKALIRSQQQLDPARLADPDVELAELTTAADG